MKKHGSPYLRRKMFPIRIASRLTWDLGKTVDIIALHFKKSKASLIREALGDLAEKYRARAEKKLRVLL